VVSYLYNKYSHENVIIQEKAVSLLFLDALLCIGFLGLGVLRISDGHVLMGIIELGVSVLLSLLCALIVRGSFRIASMSTILLFCIAASGLFYVREVETAKDIYLHSTYMIPAFLTLPLLAYHYWQVIGALLFGLASHTLHNFLRVVPAAQASAEGYALSEFLVSLILMLFSAIFIFQIFHLQNKNLNTIESTAEKARRQYNQLKNLLDQTSSSFNVGEQLQIHARINSDVAQTIAARLREMQVEMQGLDEDAEQTKNGHSHIMDSKNSVQESMQQQTEAIQNATTATEQIGAQVETTAHATQQKKAGVEELVQVAEEAAEKMRATVEAFHSISNSSARIIEVIKVIEDVADRTNLLAMNAAIEAAHAGHSGRGFAVVAGEIRSLAEETNENSRTIRATLEENRTLIGKAVAEGDALHGVFTEIRSKISEVHEGLMEVIAGMDEFRAGHSDMQQAIDNLNQVNEKVNESLGVMDKNLQVGARSVEHIAATITELRQQVDELTSHTDSILDESSKLTEIGQENVDSYTALQKEIREASEG
jgi:methyl-accepting chemotaxis protein